MCFLATSSVLFCSCFSLLSFSELTLLSFFDSSFSLTSDFLSSLGLSSNLSKASLSSLISLSISSWVISLLSKAFSARDKIRLSSFTDFSVFLLISVFLILSTKSFNSFLLTSLTSFFSVGFLLSSLTVVFSSFLLELCACFSNAGITTVEFCSPKLLFFSCLAITSELFASLAYVTCELLILIPPTTKNNEQPKRICFPFLTMRQFFCWTPCRLNNIFSLLIFLT